MSHSLIKKKIFKASIRIRNSVSQQSLHDVDSDIKQSGLDASVTNEVTSPFGCAKVCFFKSISNDSTSVTKVTYQKMWKENKRNQKLDELIINEMG